MDETLYNGILDALEAVHGSLTAPQARQAAGQMLEGFKERADGMPYALYILQTPSPRHTDQVRHFALHTLEHMLKVRWLPEKDVAAKDGAAATTTTPQSEPGQPPQLTHVEKEQMKEAMLRVMAAGTRDITQEAQFIKIKVADLVALLAERDYPNRWESFLEQMMQAWTTGPTQAELAMMVLARLIEDCHDVDFRSEIDFSRRDPILRGLNEFLPRLMPTLYNFLVQQWMGYKAAVAAAGAAATTATGATEGVLMSRALELLSKILPWAGEKGIGVETNDFLPAMAQLSTLRVVRSEALVCLEAMCAQKLTEKHFHRLMEHLPEMVLNVKQALAQERVGLAESLKIHQMLSACLEETIIRNINYIAGDSEFQDRNSRKSELLSKFLEQVLQLTQMPSKRMAANLIQAWQTFANKPNAKDMPAFVVLVPQLLAAFASHSVVSVPVIGPYCLTTTTLASSAGQYGNRVRVRFEDDVTDDVVAAEEFVDEDDYFHFLSQFRIQVRSLQLQLGKLNPLHTVRYILEQAQSLLQNHGSGRDSLDARGFPTWKTEACRAWSTFAALAKGTMVGLPHWCTGDKPKNPEEVVEGGTTAFVSSQCFEMLRSVADLIIKWQPNGSILIGHQLTVLESCRLLFVHESSMLQAVFDKLFTLLEQPDPSINLAAMPTATVVTASPEVEAVRQAASRALVVLATGVSAILVVALEGIYQRVNAVINNNKPSLTVRTHLLELLVVVSNSVKDERQRRGFVLDMLAGPMTVWVGADVTNAVSSPDVRCIHMLWAPPTLQSLLSHPVARDTLAMIPSKESEENRRKNKSGDYEVSTQDLQKLPLVKQWCRMLHDLRTVCYNLLGLACKQGALYLAIPASKVQDVIVNGLLAGFEFIENRHLPGFCSRFLEKYVVFCPPSLVRSHVEPVMTVLTKNIMPRLSAAWSPESVGAESLRTSDPEKFQVYAGGGTMLSQENLDADELDELNIKYRTHVTRGLVDLVHAGLMIEAKKTRRRAVLDVLVRGESGIPQCLVMFSVGLIKHWGDAPSCRKALAIASVILDEYDLRSNVMRQRLARDLFSGVVDALVAGAPHLQGVEWEAVVLVKTLYVSFALSGSGGGNTRTGKRDETLRKKLLSLPGVLEADMVSLDGKLRNKSSDTRFQKEAMRDVLRRAAIVAGAAANRAGAKGQSNGFWQDNKGGSGGAKGQANKSSYRNRNRKPANDNDNDYDNPSSSILWQRQRRQY
eukprot:jgi/Undpi1/9145/HiC_scaffold_26.g11603.m1